MYLRLCALCLGALPLTLPGICVEAAARSPAQGEFGFARVSAERVEIPGGLGVINIVEGRKDGAPRAFVAIEAESYLTQSGRFDALDTQTGIPESIGGTDFWTSGLSHDPLLAARDVAGNQPVHLRAGFEVAPRPGAALTAWRHSLHTETGADPQTSAEEPAQPTLTTGTVTGNFDLFNGAVKNKVTVFANKIDQAPIEDDARALAGRPPVTDHYLGRRAGVELQSDIKVSKKSRVTLGARTEREHGEQIAVYEGEQTTAFSGNERTQALYGLYSIDPFESLTLTAAVRMDDFGAPGIENTHRFSADYKIKETGTKLRASSGTSAKAPTLFQRHSQTALAVGNPDLAIEQSAGVDAGVEQSFRNGWVTVSATWFRNDISNLIEFFDQDGFGQGSPGTFQNIASAKTDGLELAAGFVPFKWLRLDSSYTRLDAVDAETGIPLPRRPDHIARLNATLTPNEKLKLGTKVLYVGQRFDSMDLATGEPRNPLDSYFRVDLDGTYELSDKAKIFFRGENVLDEDYEEILNSGAPGRTGYVGMRVDF